MAGAQGRRRAVAGLLLVIPAAVALVVSYVLPTVWTVRTSLGWTDPDGGPASGGTGRPVGLDNYREILGQAGSAFRFALSLAVLPLLVVLVVAPLLALGAHRAGRPARWSLRLALTPAMACYAPTALATGWLLGRTGRINDAGETAWAVRLALWLTTFGLVCGVGVTLFLAVLRPREPGRGRWPAGLTVGALAGLATLAGALQVYSYPALLSGGELGRMPTPVVAEYRAAFGRYEFGPAAAHATLLLAALAVLGLAAVALVVVTGLRIEVEPVSRWLAEPPGWRSAGRGAWVVAGAAAVLAVSGYGLWPWLARLGGGAAPPGVSATAVLVNTWLPPLVSTAAGVGLALLAGFGIGALRPLGRFSELLLLPFAPWLFVGAGPLALAGFDRVSSGGGLNTFGALIPPGWLAVPALVVFTMMFRGQLAAAGAGRPAPDRRRPTAPPVEPGQLVDAVRAVLPMVWVLGGTLLVVRAQDLSWAYAVATDAEHLTGPLLAVRQLAEVPAGDISTGLVLPAWLVVLLALGLGAVHLLFLDRLGIRAGRRPRRVRSQPGPARVAGHEQGRETMAR